MTELSSSVGEHESKRRKVRKGTQSCWECRRRKVRCIFAAPSDSICKNCIRRETTCISQDLPDEPMAPGKPMPSSGSNQVEARLGRVEGLIKHLANSAVAPCLPESLAEDLSESSVTETEPRTVAGHASDYFTGIPTPTTSEVESIRPEALSNSNPPSVPIVTSSIRSRGAAGKYEEISRALTAVWPSQHIIDHICTLPVGLSANLLGGISTPYSSSMGGDLPSPREMLQLPPPGSHPVLIARKLLILGTFLQGVLPSSSQGLVDSGAPYRDIMSHVVDTAIRLVTTNEDLIGSVEGIECILIEAGYQNYAGNLHRSWMAVRRATAVAQMMALHRGLKSPSLRFLEPVTRAAFDPDQICFRLVEMDCYLSLMLGLPRTSLEARFATPKALEGCKPIDRLPRIHCAMTDRILQRKENDLSETHVIDTILQKAAADMPPRWWLIPDLSPKNNDGSIVSHETMRLMYQFSHYHMLTRLHLPYMLHSSPDRRYDQSKITAVNASRETLARFVAFRTSNPAHYYCRGTDFLAFIATTVLCLAYIESYGRHHSPGLDSDSGIVFNFLAHSRPSDRGMMEQTLDIIESMAHTDTDSIASEIARILRPLLIIEAKAASGTGYSTYSSTRDAEGDLERRGKVINGGKELHVHIPHFGTINFEQLTVSRSIQTASMPPDRTTSVNDSLASNQPGEHDQQRPFIPDYPEPYPFSSRLDVNDTQPGRSQFGQPPYPGDDVSDFSSSNQDSQMPFLMGSMGTEDDWDLQGVDVALFDSLFRGTGASDPFEEETWQQWLSNG